MEKLNPTKRIAVIGAGVSSLSFLYKIKPQDHLHIDLYERSRLLSGRCSTKTVDNFTFDNGANHITTDNQRILNTLLKELPTEDLITIDNWIYPFNTNNQIDFNKEEAILHNQQPKYNYRKGINQLGSLLHQETVNRLGGMINTKFSKGVDKLKKMDNQWEVYSKDEKCGVYDYVVFGTPAFNVIKVLKESEFKDDEDFFKTKVTEELNKVEYKKIYSYVVAFEANSPDVINNFDFYALVNSDRSHNISWISLESLKQGRINSTTNPNTLLFVVQMSDEFSTKYLNENENTKFVSDLILEDVYKLLPELKNNYTSTFSNLKLWRLALPKNGIDKTILDELRQKNLFIIGDSVVGRGRVDQAMLTGFELYDYFNQNLL